MRFSGHPDHPTREKARPSKAFTLPPSVRAQTAKDYHTECDRRNSKRELLADSAAIKELMEVKERPQHQEQVVVQRRKIGRRPRQAAPSPLPFPAKTGPSSVADTGCSASGIIAAKDSASLTLPNLGASTTRIRDANGGLSNATQETLIQKNEVTGGVGKAILGPVQQSLEGVGQYADEGLVIVYHDAYNGVSVHRKEDVVIDWGREPVRTGWRSPTDKLWHWELKAPLPEEINEWVQRHSPRVQPEDIDQLPQGTKVLANNVYELPSIKAAVRFMHAVCGYPVEST